MLTKNHATLKQEVAAHVAADQVVQDAYWENGKGFFFHCLTSSESRKPAVDRFGLTLPIILIAEDIFEALSEKDAKAFFAALPDAVACDGKDLSVAHWAFLAEELRALPEQPDDIQRVIDPVIEGMDLLASGGEWHESAAAVTRASRVARSARAGVDAVYAAIYAARATADAFDARLAVSAAVGAAADFAAVHIRQRDTLLRLIKEAPIVESAE